MTMAEAKLVCVCNFKGTRLGLGAAQNGNKETRSIANGKRDEGTRHGSQVTYVHLSHSRPTEMPGCFRHMTRSGWCLADMVDEVGVWMMCCSGDSQVVHAADRV